jgi:hypothetical protein
MVPVLKLVLNVQTRLPCFASEIAASAVFNKTRGCLSDISTEQSFCMIVHINESPLL